MIIGELLLLLEYTLLVLFTLCFGLRRLAACYLYSKGTLGSDHIEHKMLESFWFHAPFRLLLAQGVAALVIGLAGLPGLLYLARFLRYPLPAAIAPYLDYILVLSGGGLAIMAFGTLLMFVNSRMLRLGFRLVLLGALCLIPITLLSAPLR